MRKRRILKCIPHKRCGDLSTEKVSTRCCLFDCELAKSQKQWCINSLVKVSWDSLLIVRLISFLLVNGRPGNSSLRLGQIQAAEKNEDVNNSVPDEKEKSLHKAKARHGKVLLASEVGYRKWDLESDSEALDFDLVRCILQSIQIDQRNRTLSFSTRSASGKKEEDSNPFYREVHSVSETLKYP